jgi:hypothetical protein
MSIGPIVLGAPTVVGLLGYTWTEPDGTAHDLSTEAVAVLDDLRGWWAPPVRLSYDLRPHTHGARFRRVWYLPRELTLPLLLQGANNAALDSLRASILSWFDPTKGEGTLTRTAVDGTARQLRCRASEGPEMDRNTRMAGSTWQVAYITLIALDPFWEDIADTVETFSLTAGGTTWFPFDPFPGLTASALFSDEWVNNPGQLEAEPVWTIEGPGTTPVLRNLTTGATLELARTLTSGESLTVDTRVDRKVVRDQSDNKVMSAVTPASQFWGLREGNNQVQVQMTGSTVDSLVTMTYRARYLGPYPGA